MFTGLVEHVGEVTAREPREGGARFTIAAADLVGELTAGDSVAVDGACLTVSDLAGSAFSVHAVPTTLGRTTLGEMAPGRRVNLERAVRAGEPLGGHLVQGHVDAVGEIVGVDRDEDALVLRVRLPAEVEASTVERGSLTVDGVSLTVADLSAGVAKLAIIPYTLGHTNFDRLEAGARVNLEADIIGKYVARLLVPYRD
jgi:riboflavin synthase